MAYYDRFAVECAERTRQRDYSRALDSFCSFLPQSGRILDIGCGSGEHMKEFLSRGYGALGVDPSSRMRELAAAQGLLVLDGTFENLGELVLPKIDGVWSADALVHVPNCLLARALGVVAALLGAGGPLFLTVPLGRGVELDSWDGPTQEETQPHRFIQLYAPDEIELALREASFTVRDQWQEQTPWRKLEWLSVVATRTPSFDRGVDAWHPPWTCIGS